MLTFISAEFAHLGELERWKVVLSGLLHKHFWVGLAKSEKGLQKWKEAHAEELPVIQTWIENSIQQGWWDSLFPMNPNFDPVLTAGYWFKYLGAQMAADVSAWLLLFSLFPY